MKIGEEGVGKIKTDLIFSYQDKFQAAKREREN